MSLSIWSPSHWISASQISGSSGPQGPCSPVRVPPSGTVPPSRPGLGCSPCPRHPLESRPLRRPVFLVAVAGLAADGVRGDVAARVTSVPCDWFLVFLVHKSQLSGAAPVAREGAAARRSTAPMSARDPRRAGRARFQAERFAGSNGSHGSNGWPLRSYPASSATERSIQRFECPRPPARCTTCPRSPRFALRTVDQRCPAASACARSSATSCSARSRSARSNHRRACISFEPL